MALTQLHPSGTKTTIAESAPKTLRKNMKKRPPGRQNGVEGSENGTIVLAR
jgi:hypothetical protein